MRVAAVVLCGLTQTRARVAPTDQCPRLYIHVSKRALAVMSSGVKKALKAARECLAKKEYKEALQHCKEALAEDRNSYDAYV